jgi:hypothetical protein
MVKQKVGIPCTIELVETRPDFIEHRGRPIARDRHSFRLRLPDGHTLEATVTRLEMQKLTEVLPKYKVEEEPEPGKTS